MGLRTVVMLNNDYCHEWMNDPELGKKIYRDLNSPRDSDKALETHHYGRVVECVHADTQTLVQLDHYTDFKPLAYTSRTYGPSTDEDRIRLLKEAADKLGYRLVRKTKSKDK